MFHTSLIRTERKITCDDDCDWGGCKGHTLSIKINNTAGVGQLMFDGKDTLIMDCNSAEALLDMLTEIKNFK